MIQKHCASCQAVLRGTTGTSSLYRPDKAGIQEIILCEPCFFAEDDLIEREGTNNLPSTIRSYFANIERNG